MNLVEFLRARLDEDERVARDCGVQLSDGKLHLRDGDTITIDARRVLAEVEAKRKIVDEHFGFLHPAGNPDRACRRCSDLRADDDPLIRMDRWIKLQPAPCTTLRLLARPYASHPDYRDEWKP